MATRGRKPKPTAQKVLQGNPGKRKLDPSLEPRPGNARARRMPRGLSDEAKAIWRKLADDLVDLGILTDIDGPAFAMLAEHYAMARKAASALAAEDLTTTDEHGMVRKHPLVQVFRDASMAFRAYATEFGLTPSSRSRLHIQMSPEQLSLAEELFRLVSEETDVEIANGD